MTLTDQPRPRVAVVGAGALGGFYGARLARAGHDVHFLARSDYDAMRSRGLSVRSFEGDFDVPAGSFGVHRDPRDVPAPDLVLVALKATGNAAYEPLVGPMLAAGTTILTLQNGLGNEDELARLFGADRVTGGMAFVCINRTGPGKIHHIDHGFLKIGEYQAPGAPPPGSTPRVERVAALFRGAGIKVDVLPDLRRGRWEKLTWNVPFNGLGAALDLTTDRLLGGEAGMGLLTRIMREVIATAAAEGIALPADLIDRQVTHTKTMGAYRSSMQVDRQAGRPLEVEAILGEPLRRARQLGVPTPTLEVLYEMVRSVDPGGGRSGPV
ncbi:MAG TPA: 2-dehydropantoate 2-reductase [Humisphaera sp.]